jgi:hypothetical protein
VRDYAVAAKILIRMASPPKFAIVPYQGFVGEQVVRVMMCQAGGGEHDQRLLAEHLPVARFGQRIRRFEDEGGVQVPGFDLAVKLRRVARLYMHVDVGKAGAHSRQDLG